MRATRSSGPLVCNRLLNPCEGLTFRFSNHASYAQQAREFMTHILRSANLAGAIRSDYEEKKTLVEALFPLSTTSASKHC